MNKDNSYEKPKIKDKIREILTLCTFIILSAVLATIIMDICIYPFALLSIKNKAVFNTIIKYSFLIIILGLMIFLPVRKILILKREGFSAPKIVRAILINPVVIICMFLVTITVASVVIGVIFLLLNNNYYLLYKITNF